MRPFNIDDIANEKEDQLSGNLVNISSISEGKNLNKKKANINAAILKMITDRVVEAGSFIDRCISIQHDNAIKEYIS